MKVVIKIILSLALFIIIAFIMGSLDSPGYLGIVLAAALVGGIGGIWKYKPKSEETTEIDKQELDKS